MGTTITRSVAQRGTKTGMAIWEEEEEEGKEFPWGRQTDRQTVQWLGEAQFNAESRLVQCNLNLTNQ